MTPTPDPTPPATYLAVLADDGGTAASELATVRRLVARGHRVVVLADDAMAEAVRAIGAELRPRQQTPTPGDQRLDRDADDTSRAIHELRPDAVVVSAPSVGAIVAAESATVPLAVLLPHDRVGARRTERMERRTLSRLNSVRANHGLPPVRSRLEQLDRADRHIVMTAADALDELQALPGVRPWLLVHRQVAAPARTERVEMDQVGAPRVPQLVG